MLVFSLGNADAFRGFFIGKEGDAHHGRLPPCFIFDFASLHVGRGIDMGSRHDDFLM